MGKEVKTPPMTTVASARWTSSRTAVLKVIETKPRPAASPVSAPLEDA